jgi:GDPmannose 4,6-dehydratase
MSKIVLITGINGQDGSYLAENLIKKDYKVYGTVRRNSILYNEERVKHFRDKVILEYADLTDKSSMQKLITQIINDNNDFEVLEIYNLAAQSHVAVSFQTPEYTAMTNGIGVLYLLEIILSLNKDVRDKVKFYQAGTSELYGNVLENKQSETTPFNPVSPYAISKLYGYYIVKNYRESYNLYAVNGVLFNHESPRRGHNFVTMKIVNGVKDIVNKTKKYIELGNIYSKRDWGHSKDYVEGMWLMMQQNKDKLNDYVLATGKTYTIKNFVERCFLYKDMLLTWKGNGYDEIGVDQHGITRVKINKKYFRPCEVELLIGDATKAETDLNWQREYDLNKLIIDMFDGY